MTRAWDLVVVGAGPAGASAAIGALRAEPGLTVLLVDRADFPRDKPCGDGIAPHVFDLLEDHGVNGLFDDWAPIPRLRLVKGALTASRLMQRPAKVVPRAVFDDRLRRAAIDAGAMPMRSRVRHVTVESDRVRVDAALDAQVLLGADGAHSQVARHTRSPAAGVPAKMRVAPGRTAFALRGYAPTSSSYAGEQVIVFGDSRQPSYAWAFDRGDGLANVGYGELLAGPHAAPTRTLMRKQLDQLLPGSTSRGHDWRGHHLPLAPGRWRPADGRVLLAGDAARLVNPLTGEGIYYAVLTGLLAGAAAAAALRDGDPQAAGALYRRLVTAALRRHLASTGIAARVAGGGPLLDAGLRAAARDQQVFDDLVDLGLAEGALTPRLLVGLASGLVRPRMCTADVDKGAW